MAKDGPQYSGSLVALEGLPEAALETQLRLLPISPQILVLPSLQQYLGNDDRHVVPFAPSSSSAPFASSVPSAPAPSQFKSSAVPFDARRYIKGIHAAAAARKAAALNFLQDNNANSIHKNSTKAPRKIVFLNGGTATSHALCIEAIRRHDVAAGGSLEQAALLFDKLIAHGVAGLDGNTKPSAQEISRLDDIAVDDEDDDHESGNDDDPITKAMRAADALDRKTEGLQPSTHILDLTITKKPRPRSLSLPIHGDLLDLLDAGRRPSQMSTSNNGSSNDDMSDNRTINSRSFYWVPPSMAAGAAGSEIYDVNNFSFISPASPTRGSSPTSTIFPVSMRLDAIASQQQRHQQQQLKKKPSTSPARQFVSYTSASTGETMRTVLLGPAPRGRTARRRPSRLDNQDNNSNTNVDDDDDYKTFFLHRHQPQPRRARSLERKPSIGAGSFSGISSISGFSGFSGSSSGNALGVNMNFFLSTSSRDPSSTRPRRTSNVSDDAASLSATVMGTAGNIPDVPMLPAAAVLEKMTLNKKKSKSNVAALAKAASSPPQKKPQLKLKTSESNMGTSTDRHYVDRGTDASPSASKSFEPVLNIIEDLVIRFDDDESNAINPALELAIQRCRDVDGAHVVHHENATADQKGQLTQAEKDDQLLFDQKTISSALPETPKSSTHGHSSSSSSTVSSSLPLRAAAAAPAANTFSTDDYDPFAPHEYNAGPKLPLPIAIPVAKQAQPPPSIKTPQPFTPAHTPPPQQRLDGELDGEHTGPRFHVLATAKFQTILSLQNALRSALGVYFSPKDTNGTTSIDDANKSNDSPTSVLLSYWPGMTGSSLWVPLFGSQSEAKATGDVYATDMVLAIGSQRDIPSDLMTKITSQLDALSGQSTMEISRGGRLDIRYLITNALQTLAAQQIRSHGTGTEENSLDWLATATSSPPSSSSTHASYVLASLAIAQLDLYLRTYSAASLSPASVRFVLLDYPSELLPVVLALQQLVGPEVIQVATVVMAEAPKYRGDGRQYGFQLLQQASSLKPKLSSPLALDLKSKEPLFMKGNYLLTSAASDIDIAAFVVSVRKRLLSRVVTVSTEKTMTTAEVASQNGMVPLGTTSQKKEDLGRYSALSTATTAAGGLGTGGSNSSRSSKIRTPPRINNLMQSPTLPSPLLINSSPSSGRRSSTTSEKEKKRVTSDSGRSRPLPPPLPLPISTKKPTTPSVSAVRPPKSPAPSIKSQQSHQSQASSLQSFQSQADSWRTTAKTPSYTATATALAPAPVVLPSGRLVAKTIQVNGPAARRAKEQAAVVVNPDLTSTFSITSVRSDNDNLSNWDAGLDVSEDGNYMVDAPSFGNGSTSATSSNDNARSNGNVNGSSNSNGVYSGGYNDEDYDDGEDDDDFENDLEMRRLMPLYMRDRAALLAAKEAAGVRGVRPPPLRNKSSQITGSGPKVPGSVAAARAVSASAMMGSSSMPPVTQQQSMTSLRGKASISSMHSQNSHGSLANKNGNEGKKALKWLGLA